MDEKQSKRLDAALHGLNEWEQEIVVLEVEDVALMGAKGPSIMVQMPNAPGVPESETGVVTVHACTRVGEDEAAETDVAEAEPGGVGEAESVGEAKSVGEAETVSMGEGVSTSESDEMPVSVGDTDSENESVAGSCDAEAIVELCAMVGALSTIEADGDCEALENTSKLGGVVVPLPIVQLVPEYGSRVAAAPTSVATGVAEEAELRVAGDEA